MNGYLLENPEITTGLMEHISKEIGHISIMSFKDIMKSFCKTDLAKNYINNHGWQEIDLDCILLRLFEMNCFRYEMSDLYINGWSISLNTGDLKITGVNEHNYNLIFGELGQENSPKQREIA